MEAIQNPSLMREMIQNTDRALSNIDAIPGGFNALRRVYQQIQEPIWDAALGPDHQKNRDDNKVKFYDLRIDEKPSVEAIPNPWGKNPKKNRSVIAISGCSGLSLLLGLFWFLIKDYKGMNFCCFCF